MTFEGGKYVWRIPWSPWFSPPFPSQILGDRGKSEGQPQGSRGQSSGHWREGRSGQGAVLHGRELRARAQQQESAPALLWALPHMAPSQHQLGV